MITKVVSLLKKIFGVRANILSEKQREIIEKKSIEKAEEILKKEEVKLRNEKKKLNRNIRELINDDILMF